MDNKYAQQQSKAIERLKAMLAAQQAGHYVAPNKINDTSKRDYSQLPEDTVYASIN